MNGSLNIIQLITQLLTKDINHLPQFYMFFLNALKQSTRWLSTAAIETFVASIHGYTVKGPTAT